MIMKHLLSLLIFCSSVCSIYALNIDDINIRDPFILNDGNRYYMYCTKDTLDANGCIRGGVVVYTSTNLKEWKGPSRVLTIPDSNALKGSVWAPEVHKYKGRYYLFATITSDLKWKKSTEGWPEYTFRGTQVFHSDSPYGPFVPFGKYPHTQLDYMALDGTLWVENNVPYMVYCHEWVQLHGDGTMELVELSEDLSQTIGTPMVLFNGSAPEWSDGLMISQGLPKGYITDGCYLYRTKTGRLLMIWSSFNHGNYAIGISESITDSVKGPWKHQDIPLFPDNGGHGMIFKTTDGQLCLVLHQPNNPSGAERARIFYLEDCGNTLKLKK